ncbi:MAG: hypothetical protein HQK53_02960 [Oligoflexia bacterium]|nr:hypothetical protein [Oligoflexia bacterium]
MFRRKILSFVFIMIVNLIVSFNTFSVEITTGSLQSSAHANAHASDLSSSTAEIVAVVKESIEGIPPAAIRFMVQKQFMRMHLMDELGDWKSVELVAISEDLLPSDLSQFTQEKINSFIDRVANNVEDNPILVKFLERIRGEQFELLSAKVKREGRFVLPEVISYALALNNLTRAEIDDPEIIQSCLEIFPRERDAAHITPWQMGLFGWAKLTSVEGPMKVVLHARKTGELHPQFLRHMLPVNITEAIIADLVLGEWNNAESAIPLAINRPGDDPSDPRLGTGGATLSADRKVIKLKMAFSKKWDDLYSSWNLSFLSKFNTFPFFACKLLIPEVSDYKNRPEEYIYRRALALYTHLNYMFLGDVDDQKNGRDYIRWGDKKLADIWGEINLEAASEYYSEVAGATSADI